MLNCAIIGCGKIAGGYDNLSDEKIRTHAKALSLNADCNLLAVQDLNLNAAKEFASKWNIKSVFNNLEELLLKERLDFISICTPTDTHEQIFTKVVKSDIKNVWLEKPAALSISSAISMNNSAKEKNINVWVNYFRRYDAGFLKVKKTLETGGIGKIQTVRAVYTKGLRNNGSHLIDLLLWFFGSVEQVDAIEILKSEQYLSASMIMKTERCSRIDVVAIDYNFFELFEIDIIGTNGRIEITEGGQSIKFYNIKTSEKYSDYKNISLYEEHKGTLDFFMQSGLARGLKGESMPNLEDEIRILKVIEKIEKDSGAKF